MGTGTLPTLRRETPSSVLQREPHVLVLQGPKVSYAHVQGVDRGPGERSGGTLFFISPGREASRVASRGTVFVVTSTDDGATWGPRRVILAENREGHVPKVVANPPIVLRGGGGGSSVKEDGEEWMLPYWRQNPRGPSSCKSSGRDWAGVVSSTDGGLSWHTRGKITQHNARNPAVDRLIEGALVPPPQLPAVSSGVTQAPARRKLQNAQQQHHSQHEHHDHHHGGHQHGRHHSGGHRRDHGDDDHGGDDGGGGEQVLQLFRTTRNVTYACTSSDRGHSWSRPFPLKDLPNPNTKIHALRLSGGQLAVAYNHHRYKFRQRSNLYVAVAAAGTAGTQTPGGRGVEEEGEGEGEHNNYHVSAHRHPRFKVLAKLEGKFAEGVMFHYPQMLQVGCTLHVIYGEHQRGIRLATIQLGGKGEEEERG